MLLGDLNWAIDDKHSETFMITHDTESLLKLWICFQSENLEWKTLILWEIWSSLSCIYCTGKLIYKTKYKTKVLQWLWKLQ